MTFLKAVEISKVFGDHTIIRNCSIKIDPGTIHVIEGKSGSGKSTILNILGSMDPPSTGKVIWKGKDLHKLNDNEQASIRANDFGFVFQSFHLIPQLTVKQNILLPLKINQIKRSNVDFNHLVKELDINKLVDKKVHLLSGGEQQRVAIARALVTSPDILFADEPTGNLDGHTSNRLIELLLHLNKTKKLTLIIVTHTKDLIPVEHIKYNMISGRLKVVNNYV